MSVSEISDIASPQLTDTAAGVTVVRRLKAVADSLNDDATVIRANASCPKRGDTYSFRGNTVSSLVCISVSIDPKSDSDGHERGLVFEITATYSNSVDTTSTGDDEENPLDDPAEIEWDFNIYQVPATRDLDGTPVVNGAGEAFDPPHMVEEVRAVVRIVRNEATYNAAIAKEYANAVNSDNFAGVEPGHAKMFPPKAQRQTRGEYTYWRISYEIEFSWFAYKPTGILAQGYMYRPTSGATPQLYIDKATGQQPSSPIPLNLDGTKNKSLNELREEQGLDPQEGGGEITPYFHEFNFSRSKAFGVFNFGL